MAMNMNETDGMMPESTPEDNGGMDMEDPDM